MQVELYVSRDGISLAILAMRYNAGLKSDPAESYRPNTVK